MRLPCKLCQRTKPTTSKIGETWLLMMVVSACLLDSSTFRPLLWPQCSPGQNLLPKSLYEIILIVFSPCIYNITKGRCGMAYSLTVSDTCFPTGVFRRKSINNKQIWCNQCFYLGFSSKVDLSAIIAIHFYVSKIIPRKSCRTVSYSPNLTASLDTITCAALSNLMDVYILPSLVDLQLLNFC